MPLAKLKPIHRKKPRFSTSDTEIRDLLKAWLFVSIAFAILLRDQIPIYTGFFVLSIAVGVGFIFHELGHKLTAQYYGCQAEFRAFGKMLWVAVIMSFFGFIFLAPGAVMIKSRVKTKEYGIISIAGPLMNIILAVLFWLISGVATGTMVLIAGYGYLINSWLAFFNMLPVWQLDGKKVYRWNKVVYSVVLAIAVLLLFAGNLSSI